jgi:Fic family protein
MIDAASDRAGEFIPQKGGYSAFVPRFLPPPDELEIDIRLQSRLSSADAALARLDGVTYVLPNPDLFVAMYVKKEALLSSQIEGTQASLQGVLDFEESKLGLQENKDDIQEVFNYIKAMKYGLEKVNTSNISLDLINEIHKILIQGTRGERKLPGTIRTEQNWLAAPGETILEAKFVPPPPELVEPLMKNLEDYIQRKDILAPLIKIALIHAQFETIHPYYDGNGRMGRLLITFYLCSISRLARPLLYLSFYLKKNKDNYYNLLNNIRVNGDWESWIDFFLKGVIEVSDNAIETAKKIIKLKDDVINKLLENNIGGKNAIKLVDLLFAHPFVSTTTVAENLHISMQTATNLINKFEGLDILAEYTGKQRYKRYYFVDYIKIIEEGTQLK